MDKIGFRKEIEGQINRYSMENGSNTPDFILADYLCACLEAFDKAVNLRAAWYKPNSGFLPVEGQPAMLEAAGVELPKE